MNRRLQGQVKNFVFALVRLHHKVASDPIKSLVERQQLDLYATRGPRRSRHGSEHKLVSAAPLLH